MNGLSNVPLAAPPFATDRINLQEIVMVLAKRWRVLVVATLLFLAAGLAATYLSPKLFLYSTTVELGSALGDGGVQPGISPAKLAGMLNVGYLVKSRELRDQFPMADALEVRAVPLGDSPLIRLETEATLDEEELIKGFLGALSSVIIKESDRVMRLNVTQDLGAKVQNLRQEIQYQKDGIARDEKELARIAGLIEQFSTKLDDARQVIDAVLHERKAAIEQIGDSPNALALLIAGNGLEEAQANFNRVDQRLNYELPRQRQELDASIARARLGVGQLEGELRRVENVLASVRETRVQIPPARSGSPIRPGFLRVVLVSSLVGLLAGLFTIFVLELFPGPAKQAQSRVREG